MTYDPPQHHIKNYAAAAKHQSSIMFASSFNNAVVRSSPSISKNVSKTRRSSSSRSSSTVVKVRAMGMKKGSLLFSFSSSRNPSHLVFKNGCSFSLSKLSLFDEDETMMTMNKDRYRSVYVEYDERNDAGRSDRDDRQQQRLFSSSLICFCLSAPFFPYYNRSRLPDHIFFPKTRRKRRRKRRRALEHHHRSVMIRTHRQQCGSSRRCCLLTSSSLSLSHQSSFKNKIKTLLEPTKRQKQNKKSTPPRFSKKLKKPSLSRKTRMGLKSPSKGKLQRGLSQPFRPISTTRTCTKRRRKPLENSSSKDGTIRTSTSTRKTRSKRTTFPWNFCKAER